MEIGGLVKCVVSFDDLQNTWGLIYPKEDEILTVNFIEAHPNKECRDVGIICLHFEEYPLLIGLCDKQINGTVNFIEILPKIHFIQEELQEAI
jgi:hypothetical protein